jgi:hypothetical protein
MVVNCSPFMHQPHDASQRHGSPPLESESGRGSSAQRGLAGTVGRRRDGADAHMNPLPEQLGGRVPVRLVSFRTVNPEVRFTQTAAPIWLAASNQRRP